jgi:WD40 repeat protein
MYRPFKLFQHESLRNNTVSDSKHKTHILYDNGGAEGERTPRGCALTHDGRHLVTATSKQLHVLSLQPSKDEWTWSSSSGTAAYETTMAISDYCLMEEREGSEGMVAVCAKDEPIRLFSLGEGNKEVLQIRADHHRTGEPISADCLAYSTASSGSLQMVASYNAVATSGGNSCSSARERKGGPVASILLFDINATSTPVARFVTRATRGSSHGQRGRILALAVSGPSSNESFDYSSGAVTTATFTRGLIAAGSSDGSIWLYDPREGASEKPCGGCASLKGTSKLGYNKLKKDDDGGHPKGPLPGITQLQWSDDGLLLYAGYRFTAKEGPNYHHPGLLAWDVRKRDRPLLAFEGRHSPTAQKIGFSFLPSAWLFGGSSVDSKILATGSADGRVLFYDASVGGQPLPVYAPSSSSSSAASESDSQPFFEPFSPTPSPAAPSTAVNGVSFGYVPSASTVVMAVASGQRERKDRSGGVGEKRKRESEEDDDDSESAARPPAISVFAWAAAAAAAAGGLDGGAAS